MKGVSRGVCVRGGGVKDDYICIVGVFQQYCREATIGRWMLILKAVCVVR